MRLTQNAETLSSSATLSLARTLSSDLSDCPATGSKCRTLPGGRAHSVLNIRSAGTDNTPVYEVPPGEFFFMGDNRDNSMDSRIGQTAGGVGFVPFEYLIGRADRVIFSSAGKSMLFFWTWRGDRFFKRSD